MRILSVALLIILASCAHHRDVRPSTSGVHKVVIKTEEKNVGYRAAFSQAEHFCEERSKKAFVSKEEYTYIGTMKEEDYQKTKTVAKVAKTVGGTVWALGGKKESNAGGVVGLGGQVADSVAGQGYKYEMTFKCQ